MTATERFDAEMENLAIDIHKGAIERQRRLLTNNLITNKLAAYEEIRRRTQLLNELLDR